MPFSVRQAQWYGQYVPPDQGHCSAFIATGSYTRDGGPVMAHNSWDAFTHGQYFNEILDLQPAEGHRMFMQSSPGFIGSFTDFFVTDAGLMGTETTIGGYSQYDPDEVPEFIRVRRAMQYADDLDQWVELAKKENNGGYANSWLLADANTGEIMRFELGLKFFNVERTKDGYFVGFNAPADPRIRNLECANTPVLKFLSYFWGPIPWMIEAAAILSAVVGHWADFAIISVLLLVNGVVGFWEENQVGNTIAALKEKLATMAPIGWKWALLVWAHALAWFLVNDWVKLAACRIFDREQPGLLANAGSK